MKFMFYSFLVIWVIVHSAQSQNRKYCDRSLCRGRPHIGCPGNARRSCPADAREIVMSNNMKSMILRMHNLGRNVLAGGRVRGLPSARQMPTLVCIPSNFTLHDLYIFFF